MRKLQKQYSADFKARVVVSALSEDRTLNEMASRSPDDALEADLYEQIGRLKVELEWLKKWGPGLEERRAMIGLGPPEISVRRQRPAQIRSTVVRRTGSASVFADHYVPLIMRGCRVLLHGQARVGAKLVRRRPKALFQRVVVVIFLWRRDPFHSLPSIPVYCINDLDQIQLHAPQEFRGLMGNGQML